MADVLSLFRLDRDGLYHNIQHTNQSSTFGHRKNQAERIYREPSGLAMVDVWWPVLGRMHVADGERQDSRSGT